MIEPFDSLPTDPEREWGEQLVELLSAAVKRRLMGDVPLGFFLSRRHRLVVDRRARDAPHRPLADPHLQRRLRRGQLRRVRVLDRDGAARSGRSTHLEILSLAQGRGAAARDRVEARRTDGRLVAAADLSALPPHAREVTVALGGDGADELFAGYDPFQRAARGRTLRPLRSAPATPRGEADDEPAAGLAREHEPRLQDQAHAAGPHASASLWCPIWMGPLDPQRARRRSSTRRSMSRTSTPRRSSSGTLAGSANLVDKVLQFYTKLYLQDDILVKVDRASMMHSLEARAPYLDIELVDFVRRIPHRYKFRKGRDQVPAEARARERAAALGDLPREEGLRRPDRPLARRGDAADRPRRDPGTRPPLRAVAPRRHLQGRRDERAFLWNFWLAQTHLASRAAAGPAETAR